MPHFQSTCASLQDSFYPNHSSQQTESRGGRGRWLELAFRHWLSYSWLIPAWKNPRKYLSRIWLHKLWKQKEANRKSLKKTTHTMELICKLHATSFTTKVVVIDHCNGFGVYLQFHVSICRFILIIIGIYVACFPVLNIAFRNGISCGFGGAESDFWSLRCKAWVLFILPF